MSIISEINRIKTNIANAYNEAKEKGAEMPQIKNSNNLINTIRKIPVPVPPVLQDKAIEITENGNTEIIADEGFDGLSKVNITTNVQGGGESEGEYFVKVMDYDGEILKEARLNTGDVFTFPEPPNHEGLTFVGWTSNVVLNENSVTVNDNNIMIAPKYTTTSGATELIVQLTSYSGLTVTFSSSTSLTSVDWGDGTINSEKTHTYSNYGTYLIKITGITTIPSYFLTQTSSVANINLKEVRCSNSISSIQDNAFRNCSELEKVILPNNMTASNFKGYIFYNCISLLAIIIPFNIISTSYSLCSGCYSLKHYCSVSTSFPDHFMYNCYSLEEITIPDNATTLTQYAFSNCYGLIEKDVIIPSSIISVGSYTFYVSNIKKFKAIGTNTRSLSIEMRTFDGSQIEEFDCGERVGLYSNYMFASCTKLKKVNLGKSTTIYANMFNSCLSLREIIMPSNITSMQSNAFDTCRALKKVKISPRISSMSSSAFANCVSMNFYDFSEHTSIPTLSNTNAIVICKTGKIVVPDNLYDNWRTASNWSNFASNIVKASEVEV